MSFSLSNAWRTKRSRMLAVLIVLVLVVGASIALATRKPQVEYFTDTVKRGPIKNVVNATGTVQPFVTVTVGSQVSGMIQTLYADYNSVVKNGELLAKIDPRNFQAQLDQAKANVAAAQGQVQKLQADLNTQKANLASSKANLDASKVAMDNAAEVFKRQKDLADQGIISPNDYDTAKANSDSAVAHYAQAQAQVDQSDAQIVSGQAQIDQAKAQVDQAKASLNQAQLNLDYTDITSPVDGVVVSRNVDVGQTVTSSLQAPVLFTIANDLSKMQVAASVDEADIGNITEAADVRFSVDAFPNRQFAGTISEIRLNPTTVQNVVTYSVMINVDNERLELKPGMTANITITVAQQDNVLKVPNASLRYLPPGVTRESEQEMLRQNRTELASLARSDSSQSGAPVDHAFQPSGGAGSGAQPGAQSRSGGQTGPNAWQGRAGRGQNGSEASADGAGQHQRGQRGGGEGRGGSGSGAAGGRARNAAPGAVLAPGQLWNPADKIQFPVREMRPTRNAILWVMGAGKKPEPKQVVLGITDGTTTQVVAGDLKESDTLIVGDTSQAAAPAQVRGPGLFGGGGGGGGNRPPGGFGR